ncbi:MAG TPA: M14 family zinc carboxypeptidase [Vicinamibacteria bacterium]
MLLVSLALTLAAAPVVPPRVLWEAWPAARFVTTPAPCLGPAELAKQVRALEAAHPGALTVEEVGRSFEGRPIHLLKVGRGARSVLLWSQMHGDEPSATPALLDVARHLLASGDPASRRILDELTLLMVPMLNPDGAERYQRRNAQEIDVNRDALSLATPEGRLLKALRDRYQPVLGFNLHDQNRRTAVGDTGALASIALLAVAGDPEGTVTPARLRAKRICAALIGALSPLAPGAIARYDEDWSPRAFGDNLTAWGTPVVLIESGGLPPGRPFTDLTRLNFVGLLAALGALAQDDAQAHDPAAYEALPRNESNAWSDVALRGGEVVQPGTPAPYRADVAFDRRVSDAFAAGCGPEPAGSRIQEIGDARFIGAAETIDATGTVLVPALVGSVHGIAAREWLTPSTLDALGRLGVAALRWHVAGPDLATAAAHAATLAAAGRPAVAPEADGAAPSALVLAGPPASPRDDTLAAALDALRPRWRGARDRSALVALAAPRLAHDGPAHLIQLRPGPQASLAPEHARIVRVFVDGRLAR